MNGATFSKDAAKPKLAITTLLGILLVVQVGLAILLKLSEVKYQPAEPTAPLLTCDFDKVSKIVIEETQSDGKTKTNVVLLKDKHGWKLPDFYDFPASSESINQMLKDLKELKKGFPVTTTTGAADHFKVSPDHFEKALYLYDDHQKLASLYLGSSPSFRANYAKTSDSDDIYTVELRAYSISSYANTWIDRTAANYSTNAASSLKLAALTLQNTEGKWRLVTPEKTVPIRKDVALSVLDETAHFTITSVLGTKVDPSYSTENPDLSFTVTMKDGSENTYALVKPKDKAFVVLKMSSQPWYVALADTGEIAQIKNITPDQILKSDADETAKEQAKKSKPAEPLKLPSRRQSNLLAWVFS